MFRLVKVLNSNTQCSIARIKYNPSIAFGPGCPLSCLSGTLSTPANTSMPDYISLYGNEGIDSDSVDAMFVNEDMVFKVEYTGSSAPYVGMSVGLATGKYKMDSVTSNSSGKGTILAVEDDKKLVYVRFRK